MTTKIDALPVAGERTPNILKLACDAMDSEGSSRPMPRIIMGEAALERFAKAYMAALAPTTPVPAEPVANDNPLGELIGSFDAAFSEGLYAALAETQDRRLKDLVERRLLAGYLIATGPSFAATPAQQTQSDAVAGAEIVDGVVQNFEQEWAGAIKRTTPPQQATPSPTTPKGTK